MYSLTKATVQGAACGFMIGVVLVIGGRLWHPAPVAAQGTQSGVADHVKAHDFQLVDDAGNIRAFLFAAKDGSPIFMLFDRNGKERARLGVDNGRPGIKLFDAAGHDRANFDIGIDGAPNLLLADADENPRALISLTPSGAPHLVLIDAAANSRARLTLNEDGHPSLTLADTMENSRAVLGGVTLVGEKTGERTIRPESSLVLFDQDGKVSFKIP